MYEAAIIFDLHSEGGSMMRSIGIGMVLLAAALPVAGANPPKVLIIYDMEGISGVIAPNYARYGQPEYSQGRESLTADVNAAIRGLKGGGAGAIWVQDGHGSGNDQEPDILIDKMDQQATFDFRDQDFDPYSTGIDGSIDAIVCIGMHARTRTQGFMAHTYAFDVGWKVNGVDFSETHIVALSAARFGIPVIMVSGDNVLGEQLPPDFPDMEYAVVKTFKSLSSAESVPRAETDRRIETAARKAMEKFRAGKFQPFYIRPPYDFRLSFRTEEQARMAARTRGVLTDGNLGVRFLSNSFLEGYAMAQDALRRGMNPLPLLTRILEHEPDGKRILQEWEDLEWQQVDPEKLPAWSQPQPQSEPQKPRKYYGDY
jgi:D-amino peptidase